MRRSRRPIGRTVGGRAHYEVAAVISVLALAGLGGPLLARGRSTDLALTIPASVIVRAAQPATVQSATVQSATAQAPVPAAAAPAPPAGPFAWFVPGGRNKGTESLAMALATIALQDNAPLYRSDTWGRTSGSAKSDHYVGNTDAWAVDLAVRGIQRPTPQTEEAARRVAVALGRPDWTGGDLQKTIDGYRFQVLWKVSGHFNHVHVGVKKV